VTAPQQVLQNLASFLDHDLDYERIRSTSLGRLRESNSSFLKERDDRNPVNRWKERLSQKEIVALESLIERCLEEQGYVLTTSPGSMHLSLRDKWMRYIYPRFLNTKLWLKGATPVGRLANLSTLELGEVADDSPDDLPPADETRVPSLMRE
jgi:hypothetical protein